LINAWAGRVDFPDLKAKVREYHDEIRPDYLIIEKKASGGPLIQELRRSGLHAYEMNPSRSKDKYERTAAVADLLKDGLIWAPRGRRWVEQVIEEMAAFPHDEYDDYHDAAVWGLLYIRQSNLIRLHSDPEDEEWKPMPPREYY
jgi:predicted phage terminase large subunit-like protein